MSALAVDRVLNTALVRDLEVRLRTPDLFRWIDEEAERLAQKGLTARGSVDFNEAICHERRIVRIAERDLSGDACMEDLDDGFVIYYRPRLPIPRMRFAIAHEIGHTYWFEANGGRKPLSPFQSPFGTDPTIEYLCDRFASALLLPRNSFLSRIKRLCHSDEVRIPPLHLIPRLAKEYSVAEQAVARRLFFDIRSQRVAVLCVEREATSGDRQEAADRWKAIWCALPAELHQRQSVSGFSIPLKTYGRVIPNNMIPQVQSDTSVGCILDQRWWVGLQAQPKEISKRKLSAKSEGCGHAGYVGRAGDLLFIAHPP